MTEKEMRYVYDQDTGRVIKKFTAAFRCTDNKIFVTKDRAIEHELLLMVEDKLDLGEFDEKTGEYRVIKAGKKGAK